MYLGHFFERFSDSIGKLFIPVFFYNSMKVLIISDTHDHMQDLDTVIAKTKGLIDVVLHCGDFCAPFAFKKLADFSVPVHAVWGNTNDKDAELELAKSLAQVTLHGDVAELTLGGLLFHLNHFPEVGLSAAQSGKYDIVCFGHTHMQKIEKVGETLVINPGAVMSEPNIPGASEGISFVVLDTDTFEISQVTL